MISSITLIFRSHKDILQNLSSHQLKLLLISGFFGVFLPQVSFCLGLSFSSPAFTAPWMLLSPIFTISSGILLNYEQGDKLKTSGLAISLAGVIGMIILNFFKSSKVFSSLLATFCLLISSASSASVVFIWKKLVIQEEVSVLVCTFWTLASGAAFMVFCCCLKQFWYWSDSYSISSSFQGLSGIVSCLFLVALGYAVTFAILTWATQKSSISTIALYPTTRPIFTVFLSLVLDGGFDFIDLLIFFCSFFVIGGLLLAAFSKEMERRTTRDEKREAKKARLKDELNVNVVKEVGFDGSSRFGQISLSKYQKLG
jgi:drug/metabolite transporter (DMT)-like permease